jgi:sulfide:quinone oxidoreductase
MTRVLVLGGGFGGLAAANVLRQRLDDEAEVVLAAQNDRFAMGFAKLWDLAGMRPIGAGTRSLHDLHERGIRFVHAQVTGIDPDRCTVDTTAGTFEADGLVVALGSRPAPDHRAWLDASGGHDLYDPAALPAMREALASIERGRVVVSILGGPFKCPPAPYEAALIVDRLLRDRGVRDDVEVVVTTPQPMSLPAAGVDASRYVADHLGDQGIVLRSGTKVAAVDGASREIALVPASPTSDAEPGRLAFDVLLGVPADAPLPVVADSGLGDDAGWVRPDRHTLRTDRERVYAIGDATVIPGRAPSRTAPRPRGSSRRSWCRCAGRGARRSAREMTSSAAISGWSSPGEQRSTSTSRSVSPAGQDDRPRRVGSAARRPRRPPGRTRRRGAGGGLGLEVARGLLGGQRGRCGRSWVIAWKASAAASSRASTGIAAPRAPWW